MSHGLASGPATTIPWNSCLNTTWQPTRECLFRTRDLNLRFSTYSSSYVRTRRELLEPFLCDLNFTFRWASVVILQPMWSRIDQSSVDERAKESESIRPVHRQKKNLRSKYLSRKTTTDQGGSNFRDCF